MRLIGTLPNEQTACRFADYLLTQGVNVMVEEGREQWTVWVEHDDHVERAKSELERYRQNPDAPQYAAAESSATKMRVQEERAAERRRQNYIDVRTSWARPGSGRKTVTIILIAISCVVAAASLGSRWAPEGQQKFLSAINPLLITEVRFGLDPRTQKELVEFQPALPEIRHGQVWRLISPIFIHFDYFHLLFNMLMLYQLGSVIEARKGGWLLGALVLVSAIPSNFLQFLWPIGDLKDLVQFWRLWPNPMAGGMSGVVYALFGYVWMKSRHEPQDGINIHPNSVFILMAWFVVCFTGLLGSIGNTAHAVGLIVGVLFGLAPRWARRLRRRIRM